MGLDVYAGSLTRYYAGAWETVVQKLAREQGLEVQVVRSEENAPADQISDPQEILPAVLEWRAGLEGALAGSIPVELSWPEGVDTPYFTDKPAWDCFEALVLWAAHDVAGAEVLPAVVPESEALSHPIVAAARESEDADRYKQLLFGAEWWLPMAPDVVFDGPAVNGATIAMGSVDALRAQLAELNRRTWRADDDQISRWRRDGADHGAPLDLSARFGFAVFFELSGAAVEHRMPMLLDY